MLCIERCFSIPKKVSGSIQTELLMLEKYSWVVEWTGPVPIIFLNRFILPQICINVELFFQFFTRTTLKHIHQFKIKPPQRKLLSLLLLLYCFIFITTICDYFVY